MLMCSETIKQESIEFNGLMALFPGFLTGYDKIILAGWDSISLDFSFNLFE